MAKQKPKTYDTLDEALRAALADSDESYLELERQTDVLRQTIMRFVKDPAASMVLSHADKLARHFRMQVIVPAKK